MTKANFQTWAEMPSTQMTPQISRRLITGEQVMSVQLILEKGAVVPEHHHPHEQISHVISGAYQFEAEGEVKVMKAGDIVFVPSNLPHQGIALEETVMIEVFSPPREDFLS